MSTPPFCPLGKKFYTIEFNSSSGSLLSVYSIETTAPGPIEYDFLPGSLQWLNPAASRYSSFDYKEWQLINAEKIDFNNDFDIIMNFPFIGWGTNFRFGFIGASNVSNLNLFSIQQDQSLDPSLSNKFQFSSYLVATTEIIQPWVLNNDPVTLRYSRVGNTLTLYYNENIVNQNTFTALQLIEMSGHRDYWFQPSLNSNSVVSKPIQPMGEISSISIINSNMPNACQGPIAPHHQEAVNATIKTSHSKIIREERTQKSAQQFHSWMKEQS